MGMMTTDYQKMLGNTAEKYLRNNYLFNKRQERIAKGLYHDPAHWRAFSEMGWISIPFPEEFGGLALGVRDASVLAELCGQYLVTEPLIEVILVSSAILKISPTLEKLLPKIIEGEVIPIVALDEPGVSRSDHPKSILKTTKSGWHLSGRKDWIAAGASATHYIISASGPKGLTWVMVESDQEGLHKDVYPTHDGRGGVSLKFNSPISEGQILLEGESAKKAVTALRTHAMLLSSAETLGAMQAALHTTIDYTKRREQFGQPLASFQALQHRMADMLTQIELSRSLVYAACTALDDESSDRNQLARAAKVKAASVGKKVTQEAIQLHGGIATTDEYIVGHFFKRVTALESWIYSRGEALKDFIRGGNLSHLS